MIFWKVPSNTRELLALLTMIGGLARRDHPLPEGLLCWLDAQSRSDMKRWMRVVDAQGETDAVFYGLRSVLKTCQPELLVLLEQLDGAP